MCHDLTQEYSHDHVVMSGLAEDTPPHTVANSNRDDHTWRHDHAHENDADETMTMPQRVILAYDDGDVSAKHEDKPVPGRQ